jgi:hypothetical protein
MQCKLSHHNFGVTSSTGSSNIEDNSHQITLQFVVQRSFSMAQGHHLLSPFSIVFTNSATWRDSLISTLGTRADRCIRTVSPSKVGKSSIQLGCSDPVGLAFVYSPAYIRRLVRELLERSQLPKFWFEFGSIFS